jgi:hypothetical protein
VKFNIGDRVRITQKYVTNTVGALGPYYVDSAQKDVGLVGSVADISESDQILYIVKMDGVREVMFMFEDELEAAE